MHAVWNIAELRLAIFEYLDTPDLARLTQTCSTFYEIATNELWRTVRSPAQLLSPLPEDFRLRPLELEDIRRLDLCARKVERICWESHVDVIRLPKHFSTKGKKKKKGQRVQNGRTWEELWKGIAGLRPNSEFLPNLRCLRAHSLIEELLLPFVGISGQDLAEIRINVIHNPWPERIVKKLLESFQSTPKLNYLYVKGGEPDLIPLSLIQQSPLKHLRLDPKAGDNAQAPIRVEVLQKCTIEHITLGLDANWHTPEIHALNEKLLPALRTMWLDLTKYEPCTPISWEPPNNPRPGQVYWMRPPSSFFRLLDNPELDLLNIKFPLNANDTHFLDVVSAANSSCRLRNLKELGFAGGGWIPHCSECGAHPGPGVFPPALREGLRMLLPLPKLKILRLSVAPNFLNILDLDLYKSFTDGLPALEKLWLGHSQFNSTTLFHGETIYERVPLRNLAAFCSMLPNLVETSIGCADGEALEESPQARWACFGVKRLVISKWAGRGLSFARLHLNLRGYFPLSDLAREGLDPMMYLFERR